MPLGCPPVPRAAATTACRTFCVPGCYHQLGSCGLTGEGEGASWSNRTSWKTGGRREAEGADTAMGAKYRNQERNGHDSAGRAG